MIRINTADIGPDGLEINGTEDAAFLELDNAGGFPCKVLDDVRYQLHASLAGRDLLVTGSARIRIKTQCALCLKEIILDAGSDKICIFREKVPDEIVDITEDIREDILLAIPDRFKCSESCRGLCPGCGADLNEESCRCKKKKKPAKPDHTWDALDKLKF
ncbi:MAG: DUF177 domain-containing protein [Lentisphaeria bacterium]|nr:DUF177 domain-containing protein [Lentisphaeria bacterium]